MKSKKSIEFENDQEIRRLLENLDDVNTYFHEKIEELITNLKNLLSY